MLPSKTTLTLLTLGALLMLPALVPSLANYASFHWDDLSKVLEFHQRKESSKPIEEEVVRMRPGLNSVAVASGRLHDPHHNLDTFYRALFRLETHQPGAVVRILHYGDSPTTADLITADTRGSLQRQFGDAGHGFYLIARPWAWYAHRGLDSVAEGWNIDPANQSGTKDGLYGLGGVSFQGQAGAWARVKLKEAGHRKVEVSFLRRPEGGTFLISTGDLPLGTVETAGADTEPGYASFPLPEGARTIEIKVDSGKVRLFGLYLEKPASGVIYSSLGLNGAYVSVPARMFNEAHWTAQLRHYRPDLVVVNYGTNESVYAAYVDQSMPKEMKEVVRRIRLAVPDVSILIMSPMDRGERGTGGDITTVPVMPHLVETQQKVAGELHCGFFNTFQAMGGSGTMAKWYQAEPRLVGGDFIHPMPAGARIVANLLHTALLDGYNRYKARSGEAGPAPLTTSEIKR